MINGKDLDRPAGCRGRAAERARVECTSMNGGPLLAALVAVVENVFMKTVLKTTQTLKVKVESAP